MKAILSTFLVLFTFITAAVPVHAAEPRTLFVGNSLVRGLELYSPRDDNNLFICKSGISLDGLMKKYTTDMILSNYDVAVIEMGTNELGNWSETKFTWYYMSLIDTLQQFGTAKVYCCSIVPTYNRDGTRFNNANVRKYNQWIRNAAEYTGAEYLDCTPYFGTTLSEYWTADGVHMYPGVYNGWYRHIKKAVL